MCFADSPQFRRVPERRCTMKQTESLDPETVANPAGAPPHNMTEAQCAQYLTISTRSLRNLRRRRVIPFVKLGGRVLYRRAEVDRALTRLEIKSV